MQKIVTVFRRDPEDMSKVLTVVNEDARWVLDGEGVATRKYDGTCVMMRREHVNRGLLEPDNEPDVPAEKWYARREVKPGKTPPPNYEAVSIDPETGKTVGWEPAEQSGFAAALALALANPYHETPMGTVAHPEGTYELIGPKINGDPEGVGEHLLIRHADAEPIDESSHQRTYEGIRALVLALHEDDGIEGIVYHHPDGRMAKIKARDWRNELRAGGYSA